MKDSGWVVKFEGLNNAHRCKVEGLVKGNISFFYLPKTTINLVIVLKNNVCYCYIWQANEIIIIIPKFLWRVEIVTKHSQVSVYVFKEFESYLAG